jgi:hypothetical protein
MAGYLDQVKENPTFKKTKSKLDSVGCGMCLAKWTQVTLQLQTGHNHSCHHPKTHKISENEIKRNPSALHNTQYKKLRRREMLTGKRPKECDYCWGVEDNSDRFSDRVFKSGESWSLPHMDEIINSDWRADYNPKYVEVAFSNACNFKCSYCGPPYSSTWMDEINNHGAYPTSDRFNSIEGMQAENKVPILHKDYNPYVEAFWKWWPDLYQDLHTFRITGGEPMLAKDTWKVLDYIIEQKEPNRNLNFAINSNLGLRTEMIEKLIDKINRIEDEDRVNEFIIFTSLDGWGKKAEYQRFGLDFNLFWDNLNLILEKCPRVNATIMATYNALSVSSYDKVIKGVYDLKTQYGSDDRYWNSAVFLDSSYLRFPLHQTVQVLPKEMSNLIYKQAQLTEYMATPNFETRLIGYSDIEVQKIRRIYDWMLAADEEKIISQRQDFYRFFKEHDKRRGTNFKKTFPELADFYEDCKKLC